MNVSNHISLKTSIFNLVIFSSETTNVIYNTLQDSITLLNKTVPYTSLSSNEIKDLHNQGVIVNAEIDERSVFRYRNMSQKTKGKRLHIFLTLTGACNCNCPYCFAHDCYSGLSIKKSDIPFIMNFISQQLHMHRSSMLNIDFFGGEPLLCEEIFVELLSKIQHLCDSEGIRVAFQVYSNGTITPSIGFSTLRKYDITYLITLDGPQEAHDRLRPMKNGTSSYSQIINNLDEIKKADVKAVIRINFGKKSYLQIPKLLDEIVEFGLNSFPIEFYPVQNMSQSSSEYEDAVTASETAGITEYLWDEAEKRNIRMSTRTTSTNCYCSAFTNSMFVVDPGLNVYKCALLQCDPKYSIGNLKKNTDFMRDSVFYDWVNYDPSTEKGCKDCVCLPICAGGCGGSGTFRYGSHHHSNCYDLSPAMVKMRMRRYVSKKYSKQLEAFSGSNKNVLVIEKSRYSLP